MTKPILMGSIILILLGWLLLMNSIASKLCERKNGHIANFFDQICVENDTK